jgi:hypothetical protein
MSLICCARGSLSQSASRRSREGSLFAVGLDRGDVYSLAQCPIGWAETRYNEITVPGTRRGLFRSALARACRGRNEGVELRGNEENHFYVMSEKHQIKRPLTVRVNQASPRGEVAP